MLQCPTKYELLQRHAEVVRAYAKAVSALSEDASTSHLTDWSVLYTRAEHARMDMERARLEYQNHAEEHGC